MTPSMMGWTRFAWLRRSLTSNDVPESRVALQMRPNPASESPKCQVQASLEVEGYNDWDRAALCELLTLVSSKNTGCVAHLHMLADLVLAGDPRG